MWRALMAFGLCLGLTGCASIGLSRKAEDSNCLKARAKVIEEYGRRPDAESASNGGRYRTLTYNARLADGGTETSTVVLEAVTGIIWDDCYVHDVRRSIRAR